MSTQDFKPGDRVKYVATDPDTTTPSLEGHLGTVAALDAFDVEVEWDNPPTGARGVLAANLRKVDATQPEDATDAYVEHEPLKEGDGAFNDDDVQHLKVIAGSEVIFDGLAVFEEAGNGNVIVTPVPRCTSLFLRHKSESDGGIVRCGQHEGHDSSIHWTIGLNPATSWPDNREYARITEGGAS